MKVYLSEYIDPVGVDMLKARGAELITDLDHPEELDAMLVRGVKVTRELMEKAKNLKVVAKHGVGYNTIDVAAAKELGIRVVYTPGMNSEGVAEMAVTLMLDAARSATRAHCLIAGGQCARVADSGLLGCELFGKTVALVGFGNISRRVARIVNGGFDARVLAYDKYLPHEAFEKCGVEEFTDIDEMVAQADFISVSIPLTDETRGIISARQFELMKDSCILVNTSRGGTVDERALYEALRSGKIAAAGSDVFEEEPPRADHPLFSLPNFVGTSHLGGNTREALYRCAEAAAQGIIDVLDGKEPAFPVV